MTRKVLTALGLAASCILLVAIVHGQDSAVTVSIGDQTPDLVPLTNPAERSAEERAARSRPERFADARAVNDGMVRPAIPDGPMEGFEARQVAGEEDEDGERSLRSVLKRRPRTSTPTRRSTSGGSSSRSSTTSRGTSSSATGRISARRIRRPSPRELPSEEEAAEEPAEAATAPTQDAAPTGEDAVPAQTPAAPQTTESLPAQSVLESPAAQPVPGGGYPQAAPTQPGYDTPTYTEPAQPGYETPTYTESTDRPSGTYGQPAFETPRQPLGGSAMSSLRSPAARDGLLFQSLGPALRVETAGPKAIVIGKEAEYTITVRNEGNFPASEVYVRVGVPNWVEIADVNARVGTTQTQSDVPGQQRIVWSIDHIGAGDAETVTMQLAPSENQPFDLMVDWTIRPVSSITQIEVQQPRLEMAVFGPKSILYGESASYAIQLSNPGNGVAENVAVQFAYGDQRLDRRDIGTLSPGEQTEVTVELTAQQAGALRIAALATGDGNLRAEASEEILVRRANLAVAVVGSTKKYAGGVGTYKVTVKNTGDASASNVVAQIRLPRGATLLNGEAAGEDGVVSQSVGTLIPGAERVISLTCQLNSPGENRVEATAKSQGGLEGAAIHVTQVEALADLKLLVNDPRGPTAVGALARYEIHVVNRGTKAAERISIIAQFSEGIEPIEATGGSAEIVPGQVLFDPVPRVNPGEELILKITARADRPGNHRFRAEVTGGNPDTRLVAEESTHFFGDDTQQSTATRSTGIQPTR